MSNFQCPHCGMTNIDCGKEGYKTPREIELEKKLKIAEEVLNDIKNSFFEDEDKEIITHAESIYYYSKAKETLQKMKEVKNEYI